MKSILRGIIVVIVAGAIAWCGQFAIDQGKLGDLHFAEGRGPGFRVGDGDGGEGRHRGQGGAGELVGTLLQMTAISTVVVIGGKIRQARHRRRSAIR